MRKITKYIPLLLTPFVLSSCGLVDKFLDVLDRIEGNVSSSSSSSNSGSDSDSNSSSSSSGDQHGPNPNEKRTWSLFLYICGADLESDSQGGYASGDIAEILSAANQPGDVNIVLECGGASKWKNSTINAHKDKLSRWHVSGGELYHHGDVSKASMGESSTLSEFLTWGVKNYPAEKYGLFMWDHGGALTGCCFDENFSDDCLYTNEIASAMATTKSATSDLLGAFDKFEFITYDACLMALQEVAEANAPYFNYMLASQESESGYGYDYDAWLPTLYSNPKTVTSLQVLSSIGDTFMAEQDVLCEQYNWPYDQTQSVFDLSKMGTYKTAFDSFATDLMTNYVNTSSKWNSFKSIVTGSNVKSYGEDEFDIFNLAGTKGLLTAMKSSYSGLSTKITALENALADVVVYENHQSETYGCGMCVTIPVKGDRLTESEFSSQCNFSWKSSLVEYGTFYSGWSW